ncbi:MAG: hypothetical protein OHK0036_13560 [Bacteroidia bacterium]
MKKWSIYLLLGIFLNFFVMAQKKNVNAAWRALTDYQSTLNDKPNLNYLLKAKESIDLAIQNPETKEDAKALTYYSQIYFELFKYYQNNPDKSIDHYGYLNTAIEAFNTLKEKHPKVAATPEIQNHGIFLLNTSNQEAVKLFNEKKYSDASQLFLHHYQLQKKILNTTDTSGIFNAFVCAYKSNSEKTQQLANEMIQNSLDNVKMYQLLYNYYIHKKDTTNALQTLQKGRSKFSNDATLLNLETDFYINTKQYNKAINNLEQMIQTDSTNALLLLTLGNLYDNLANFRMAQKNYSDTTNLYFQKAIENYNKSYRFKYKLDKENLFTLTYNIGAYYTNYGLYYYNRKMKEFKITDLSQKQKEVEDKRKEYTQMGLPYLKEAETIKPNDNAVITALYKVYALIGDNKNAEVYKNKMLGK